LKRGDVVVLVLPGDYGKPRPGVIVQGDRYSEHPSITVLPLSTTITELDDIRLTVSPTVENGLREISQVMGDKIQTIPREKIGQVIGRLGADEMVAVDRALALFLGFA
jgi:mRNA interferase MazF